MYESEAKKAPIQTCAYTASNSQGLNVKHDVSF